MESIKCSACGLVNWEDGQSISCKRCGAPLWVKEESRTWFVPDTPTENNTFSGPVLVLAVILALALVLLILQQGLNLIEAMLAKQLSLGVVFIGLLAFFIARIWLVIRIFEQGVWWGLGALCVPFVGLVAVINFWDKLKRSFIGQLLSLGIIGAGLLIATGAK